MEFWLVLQVQTAKRGRKQIYGSAYPPKRYAMKNMRMSDVRFQLFSNVEFIPFRICGRLDRFRGDLRMLLCSTHLLPL